MPKHRFPYASAAPMKSDRWGVRDQRQARWAEPPDYDQDTALLIAAAMNEAYAAGFADAKITKARRGLPGGARRDHD